AIRRVAAIPVMPFDDTLVIATTRPTALVVLDRDGVAWVEARHIADRDPELLRQTARSRWSVPYDELVELRVRAVWWGGASLIAIIRPSRAALAAVGGVAGACLLSFAADLGVRTPTWSMLGYAVGVGLVCAVAAWLAVQPRSFGPRPADYVPILAVLTFAVALTWAPLLVHLWRTSQRTAVAVHLM